MGGQDGFSRDLLSYSSDSDTLVAGLHLKPAPNLELHASLAYVQSSAGLDPFDLPAADYVAITPAMIYDFSIAHTYSDLDLTRTEGELGAKLRFGDGLWLRLNYLYLDYTDDAPYLYEADGRADFITAAFGIAF